MDRKDRHVEGLSCGCGHCGDNIKTNNKKAKRGFKYLYQTLRISFSLTLFLVAFLVSDTLSLIFFVSSSILVGYDLIFNFFKNIIKLNFFDEHALMLIASVTAYIIGEYFEGALILILFYLGEFLETVATDNSKKKIIGLSKLKISVAHLITSNGFKDVCPEQVEIGSFIEVKSGETVPIDGEVVGASCDFDMKAITGESKLVCKSNGEIVYSGAVNVGNPVVIKTTKKYEDSTVENIISMVEGSLSKKAKSQKFISKFAKIYTPIIFALAIIIAVFPPLLDQMNFIKWIYKALSFLVISCPCALVISIPLSFFVAIGGLAKYGVLVKGSSYIETLSKIKTVVFDKTGTLTYGNFIIDKIESFNGFTNEEVFEYACSLEKYSNHPISKAFDLNNKLSFVDVKELPGKGLIGEYDGKKFYLGNDKIMKDNNIEVFDQYHGTVLYLSMCKDLIGKIYICDKIKENAAKSIVQLKKIGVKETFILSGDQKCAVEYVSKKVGVSAEYSNLLPGDKVSLLKEIKNKTCGSTVYVGDGINDSPCLALADVGFAMGGLGSEIASSSADIVIMDDNLEKIAQTVIHARKVKRIIFQNIIGSLAVKFAIMILSIFISLPVWVAMFADVGVMLLAVWNSLRVGKIK